MRDKWIFLEMFGEIDESIIEQAGRPWKKINYRKEMKIAGFILVAALCISGIFHSEVKAGIEKIIFYIEEILGIKEDISSYTKVLNKTIRKNGLSITVEEVLLEESELIVAYRVEPDEKKWNYNDLLFENQVWINGKKVRTSEYHALEDSTEGLYRFIECYRFDEEYINENEVAVKIVLSPALGESYIGEYVYEFTASCEEISANTVEIPLELDVKVGDSIMELRKFTLNGIESRITGTTEKIQNDWDYYIKGKDNLGNQVRYRMQGYSRPDVEFVVDKTEGYISPGAEWVELQFYVHESQYSVLKEEENGNFIEGEYYDESDFEDMHPVGEAFKIQIKGK